MQTCNLLTLALISFIPQFHQATAGARDRTCCRYSCQGDKNSCPSWCGGSDKSCVIADENGDLLSDPSCEVIMDSKKDKFGDYKQECLNKKFTSKTSMSHSDHYLPFHLLAYPFTSNSMNSQFSGLDVRINYGQEFSKVRFRIQNKNPKICPLHTHSLQEGSLCNPRCVEIERDLSNFTGAISHSVNKSNILSYDCEAGFYKSRNTLISTAEDDHEISICIEEDEVEQCGAYLFQLPDPAGLNSDDNRLIVLVDKFEYEQHEQILLFVPLLDSRVELLQVSMIRVRENTSSETVYLESVSVTDGDHEAEMIRIMVNLPNPRAWGRLQAMVTSLDKDGVQVGSVVVSAYLVRQVYGQHALVIVTAILVIVLLVGSVLLVYRRWRQVAEAGAVEPVNLVQAGRLKERAVLVITPLDNPEHVEVVKDMCRYLRDWCGVGITYFAMDEETGIGCGQHDPWKWCQETGELVRDNGSIIFIPGPDPSLVTNTGSIHPNLEQNQAFLTTRHLSAMAGEGRVMVVKFSYSSLKTLPQEVPDHLKTAAFHLPKQMNEFLLQLLQVKKKALCNLLPFPLVRPAIKPSDLSRAGGPELVQRIRQLNLQTAEHRATIGKSEEKLDQKVKDQRAVDDEELSVEGEELLSNQEGEKDDDRTLKIDIESALPSTRNMSDRNRFDTEDD